MTHPKPALPRYSDVNQQKSDGATYTPQLLARFVAQQMLSIANFPEHGVIRVLDPAVGDGELLDALINQLPVDVRDRLEVIGYDTDLKAIEIATERLKSDFPRLNLKIFHKNFIDYILDVRNSNNAEDVYSYKQFNLVIANPPYVRTQIIGSKKSQQISKNFGLTGRVDLYYPFLLGISDVLMENGVAGIITSNRFMTTKSGQAIRRELLSRFTISHVWDFGDTKLFEAAVLPSVLITHGISSVIHKKTPYVVNYSSIYETADKACISATDAISALSVNDDSIVSIPDGRRFKVRHGILDNSGDSEAVWRISTKETDTWLSTVNRNTWATFSRIGKIRVGVKSTADKVFIRNDWDDLPSGRPELLYPLITRHSARRFKSCTPIKTKHIKEILYPHEATKDRRGPVDLDLYPKARNYLEQHRSILEARTYVIKAGRRWYELWVPQDPAAWHSPKLVFPDISEKPIFWIDMDGGIVSGECYWLRCENDNENDLLWLALAIANSTFIETFYDHRFNNKLYAGRRRFITQYVEQFPLPDPSKDESKSIISLAKEIYNKIPSNEYDFLEKKLDDMVWDVFGVLQEKISR